MWRSIRIYRGYCKNIEYDIIKRWNIRFKEIEWDRIFSKFWNGGWNIKKAWEIIIDETRENREICTWRLEIDEILRY